MSVYLVTDKKTIAPLFDGWEDTMIWSCLQDYMGIAYADSLTAPKSAQISIGDFIFFAGEVNAELIENKPSNLHTNSAMMAAQSTDWEEAIEAHFGKRATRHTRYATRKDTMFDEGKLRRFVSTLDRQFEIRQIDKALYDEALSIEWAMDWCSNYASYEEYSAIGLGFAIIRKGEILSGASSYTSYRGGIEVQVDTRQDLRKNGLATACAAKLILECLERGWYPSWDAHNKQSLALSQKLGYQLDGEYLSFILEY